MALHTIKEVAAFCGTSEKTIWRAVWGGQLAHVRLGRLVRVRDEDLQRWIDSRTVAPWATAHGAVAAPSRLPA